MARKLYDIRNYPKRSGTSQNMRYDKVLHGEMVKLDERNIEDFILFADRLSGYLKYYNLNNEVDGNWQAFLKEDISYQLAKCVAVKSSAWSAAWNELMEPVEENTDAAYKKYFAWRFDFLYSLLDEILQAYAGSFALNDWNNNLGALLSSAQLNVIYFLLEKYKTASQDLLVDTAGIFSFNDITLSTHSEVSARINTLNNNSRSVLQPDPALFADADFIFGEETTVPLQVTAASEYLAELATQLINIYSSINELAAKYLAITLSSYDAHQPHVGLFYAFLKLAQQQQAGINELLLKHLDFYYRDVLQVKEKSWQPTKAFVHFELAKNVNEHFIAAGSKLAAGKDPGGKDIFFTTADDILVNKASIAELRSFTHIKNEGNAQNLRQPAGFFACEVANSADGQGKALQAGQSWQPFLTTDAANNLLNGIGLSFNAPLLADASGDKKNFTLEIGFGNNVSINNTHITFIQQYMSLRLITDKDPLLLDMSGASQQGNGFKFSFTLNEEIKVINNQVPNASIIVGHKSGVGNINSIVSLFQTASIVSFILSFSSEVLEVTNVETTAGLLEISGAFPAFGAVPKPGSSFCVVAPVLKNRTVQKLDMVLGWGSPTERSMTVDAGYDTIAPMPIATGLGIGQNEETSVLHVITQNKVFTNTDRIKLTLKTDLGYSDFGRLYTEAVLDRFGIETAADDSDIHFVKAVEKGVMERFPQTAYKQPSKKPFPQNPYTPMLKDIQLKLTVSEKTNNSSNAIKLYQQYAFGYIPVALNNAKLVPATPNEGELYIGLKDLLPEQTVNILFQVEEGSADPSLDNADLEWQYLHSNSWHAFDESLLHDNTKGLIQSGIVSLVWPASSDTSNTLMPGGLSWIRASIPFNQANAVCSIIGVHTQAVQVLFQNNNNSKDWLGTNLPASSISNLSPKQAEVKKVYQPYASFGGAVTEDAASLYTRSSERLRHKGRAVTPFDFERMVLQEFPNVYKVKVLNHACLNHNNEIISKQGNVLILTIAKTSAQSALYKPLVSKSVLTSIYEYVKPLASPFAKIKVMNPVFEELKLAVEAVFMPFITDRIFYEEQLQADLKQFLSPWAFDQNTTPEFGGAIYKAAVLDFIEELPYIDFIKKLELLHNGSPSNDMAAATSPAAMLISANKHTITGLLANNIIALNKTETVGCC